MTKKRDSESAMKTDMDTQITKKWCANAPNTGNYQSHHIQLTVKPATVILPTNPQKLKCVIPIAPLKLLRLVLPNSSLASSPVCPFEVANTEGLTVAVPTVLVNTVVGKVWEAAPEFSVKSEVARKTRAAQGAGTTIEHVPGVEQVTV